MRKQIEKAPDNNRLFFRYLSTIALSFVAYFFSYAQQSIGMDEAVAVALANHPIGRNAALAEQKDKLMQRQAVELAPVQAKYWQLGTEGNDRLWSVTQDFGVIPEYVRRSKHYRAVASANRAERSLTVDELAWQVKAAYLNVVYYRQRLQIMREHDRFFEALIGTAETCLAADSIDDLTKVSTGARYAAYQSRMYIAEEELKRAENKLRLLMYVPDGAIIPSQTETVMYLIHPDRNSAERFEPVKHKAADEAQSEVAASAVALEKSKLFPAVHAGYINGNITGIGGTNGWMVGLSLPLLMQTQRARIKQAEIDMQMQAEETGYRQFADRQHIESLKSLLNEYFVQISYSKENLLEEAELILSEIEKKFAGADIKNHAEAFSKVHQAVSAKLNHLEYINLYNQTALELEYCTR